ncbi:complement factor B-like isoform X2 [Festucalex cinctus]
MQLPWVKCAVLLCLLIAGEVRSDCTEDNVQIDGGHYTLSKGLNVSSVLVYHCPEGFYPYPFKRRKCQLSDTWSGEGPKSSQRQTCKMVECPNPFMLMHGSFYPPQEKYFVNNETTYECYSGCKLRGSSSRVCLPNGKWSGSTPICRRDSGSDCPDPGIPAGALRTGNSFGLNDKVKYRCRSNLFLVGPSERVCLENGQWTGTEPACYYDYTYDTPQEVSEAFGSSIKNSLTTLEPIDDTQEGRTIRISRMETLNIYIGVDISKSIDEEYFEDARDAVSKLITKISSFPISPNYEVIFFSSDIFEVANIIDFMHGNLQPNVLRSRVDNFTLDDKNTMGTDLNLLFSTFLEHIAVMRKIVGDEIFKEHRHVIIVFTDGGFNMGGSPEATVEKIKHTVYMDPHYKQKQTLLREDYLDIYIFTIGAEIFDNDLIPLAVGTGGKHYFRLESNDKLLRTFDEIIDENEVKGLCGLHKEYKTWDERLHYPWAAEIVIQNKGRSMKCMGSLVTPMFVLTAAHCFTFDDLPKHVTVDIDDGNGKTKKVRNFFLHPEFNIKAKVNEGVEEFFDYDVALIQLTTFVQISTRVRPICIPCTQETSYALKLVGESTCAQQEELLLKNLDKLSFLTPSYTKWVDVKDVHVKLDDKRDECIEHALNATGITTKDAKVPVTENFLCTGGLQPFRDHIACKGDGGGAVFKNYEHRTVQVGLVSWGTKHICQRGGVLDSHQDSRDFHINLFRVVPFLRSILGNDNQEDYAPLGFLNS